MLKMMIVMFMMMMMMMMVLVLVQVSVMICSKMVAFEEKAVHKTSLDHF